MSTVAQITLLEPVNPSPEEGPLCIVNTHLYFHPRANFIRTLHTAVMMTEARAAVEAAGGTAALLFFGDLNSGHNKGTPGPSLPLGDEQISAITKSNAARRGIVLSRL